MNDFCSVDGALCILGVRFFYSFFCVSPSVEKSLGMLGVDRSSSVWSAQLLRRRDVVVLGVLHWSDGLGA